MKKIQGIQILQNKGHNPILDNLEKNAYEQLEKIMDRDELYIDIVVRVEIILPHS